MSNIITTLHAEINITYTHMNTYFEKFHLKEKKLVFIRQHACGISPPFTPSHES